LGYLQQSLTIQQEISDRKGEGTTLNNISLIHSAKGDYDRALGCLQQSLKIQHEIGDRAGMCPTLHNMAFIYLQQKGDVENFLEHEQEALQIALEIGNAQGIFEIGRVFGQFLCENGATEQGLPILSLALQAGQQAGFPGAAEVAAAIQHYTHQT
jgi:tetratricopeptide (TPR) repeat protein